MLNHHRNRRLLPLQRTLVFLFVLISGFPANQAWAASETQKLEVTSATILAAMQKETGYDPVATTNVARFQANVILRLARQAKAQNPNGPPLFIAHDAWFRALLQHLGLDEITAPKYARLAYENKQDQLIEYCDDCVVAEIRTGPQPLLSVTITVFWPDTPDAPSHYSFEDTLAVPRLLVTNHQHISYRLLDFGNMIMYDEISGLTGRPTSGVLGLLFNLIGEGRILQSRIAITDDGLQIVKTSAKKGFFNVSPTVTVWHNGRMEKGVPEDRQDLSSLLDKLNQSIEFEYKQVDGARQ